MPPSKWLCIIVHACIDFYKQIVIIANRIHFNANQVAVWFMYRLTYYISNARSYAHTRHVNKCIQRIEVSFFRSIGSDVKRETEYLLQLNCGGCGEGGRDRQIASIPTESWL